jgi:hypothetical protein
MSIAALELLRRARAAGMTFTVSYEGEVDYRGPSASAAWQAVRATTEADVTFHDAQGVRLGWAYLMAPGPVAPDETIVDCSGKIEELCDSII